jgi:hypothetical protein
MLLLIVVLFHSKILMLFKVAYGACESCYIYYSAQEKYRMHEVIVVIPVTEAIQQILSGVQSM